MSLYQRISATLRANVEQLVDQIENQDAVVEAAIREMKQANARARARLRRVQQDREAMEKRLGELEQAAALWQRRAIASATSDEATALECLGRHNQCLQKGEALGQTLQQHRQNQEQLEAQIGKTDERIQQLAQRRHLMRSRESNVEAMRVAQQWQASGPIDVDAVFERWEGRLVEAEPLVETVTPVDALERRFREEEEQVDLRNQLRDLMQREQGHE